MSLGERIGLWVFSRLARVGSLEMVVPDGRVVVLGSGDPKADVRIDDYAVVGDSGVEVVRSFLLDTTLLNDAALRNAGLEQADTDDSDHLPIVIDLRRTSRD